MFGGFIMTFRQYGLLLIVSSTSIAVCATCLNIHTLHSVPQHASFFFLWYDSEDQTTIIFKIQFSFDMTPCFVITRPEIDFVLFDKSTNRDGVIYQMT